LGGATAGIGRETAVISDFESAVSEYLAVTKRENDRIVRLFDKFKEPLIERPLVLYGAVSTVGGSILEIFRERGLSITCFCDPQGGSGTIGDIPIIGPQTLKNDFANAIVVICSHTHESDFAAELAALGFQPPQIIPWEWSKTLVYSHIGLHRSKSFHRHIGKYSWAFDFFEDEISKQTVLDRLGWYLCGKSMDINTPYRQYFEDGYISLGEREIFIDGGAHVGESAVEFIRKVESANGGYAHIYSFEPDSKNYARAVENTSKYPNVTVIPKGLWNMETELSFFEKGDTLGSSFVNIPVDISGNSGSVVSKVPVTSLDIFFANAPDIDLPTFIKMDIEGAEKEALIGSQNIIRHAKPKLAICAYHKPEDIYVLPQTILRIREDYRFALRQYMAGGHETVLYAV